jgi:hypothetical protein
VTREWDNVRKKVATPSARLDNPSNIPNCSAILARVSRMHHVASTVVRTGKPTTGEQVVSRDIPVHGGKTTVPPRDGLSC